MSAALEARLAAVVRGDLPALYLRLDADDRVRETNGHTRELVGPSPEGRRLGELLVTFQRDLSPAALVREGPVRRRLSFLSVGGMPRTYDCWLESLEGGALVLGGASPAEEERLQRELLESNRQLSNGSRTLQQANAELARLGRLKDQFIGMAAHDLRSPLTSVMSFAGALAAEVAPLLDEAQRADLAAIRDAARLMKETVDAFLDLSLMETGQLALARAPTALGAVAGAALALARPHAEAAGVRLRLAEGAAPPVPLDASRAQQVVMNLVGNAVRHSPAGGEVVVEVEGIDGGARLRVLDDGPGVPPELLPDLFTAWVHGQSAAGPGERRAGLGLAIARLIVEAHGGGIAARNGAVHGAVFEAWFPGA